MKTFRRSAVPNDPQQLPQFLRDLQVTILQAATRSEPYYQPDILYAAPTQPLQQMLVFADGTQWNPGSGAGPYIYIGSSWIPMFGGTGTVTTLSVATANGFAGSVATPTTTPVITLTTSITGLLKGNGTAMSAAVAGTDYVAPSGSIGAATGTSLVVTGALTSSGGGVGYATGAGGTVTQATSKSTGVSLNTLCGTITLVNTSLAAGGSATFTLTNSFVAASDFVAVQHTSVGTLGAYGFGVAPAAGSASITVRNTSNGSLAEAIVLRFVVIKAVTA